MCRWLLPVDGEHRPILDVALPRQAVGLRSCAHDSVGPEGCAGALHGRPIRLQSVPVGQLSLASLKSGGHIWLSHHHASFNGRDIWQASTQMQRKIRSSTTDTFSLQGKKRWCFISNSNHGGISRSGRLAVVTGNSHSPPCIPLRPPACCLLSTKVGLGLSLGSRSRVTGSFSVRILWQDHF